MILEIIECQRTATQRKCIVTNPTTEFYRRTAFGQSKFSGDMQVGNPSEIGSEESVLALKG